MRQLDFVLSVVLPFAQVLSILVVFGLINVYGFYYGVVSLHMIVYHLLLVVKWRILIEVLLKVFSLVCFCEVLFSLVDILVALHELQILLVP